MTNHSEIAMLRICAISEICQNPEFWYNFIREFKYETWDLLKYLISIKKKNFLRLKILDKIFFLK